MPAPIRSTRAARQSRPHPPQAGRAAHWIGDIAVTADGVTTPSGRSSIEQVEWQIGDAIAPAQWAGTSGGAGGVVGTVRVTASAPGWTHVTAVRVTTLDDVTAIYAKVLRARRRANQLSHPLSSRTSGSRVPPGRSG